MDKPRVIIIFGPSGSGKSTLAKRIARNKKWIHLCEDHTWNELKKKKGDKGHIRHAHEQDIVFPTVYKKLLSFLDSGDNVVLEFVVYEDPPRPLLYYKSKLSEEGVQTKIFGIRPSIKEIVRRKEGRGRETDRNRKENIKGAKVQIKSLYSKDVAKDWLITGSKHSTEEIYQKHIKKYV